MIEFFYVDRYGRLLGSIHAHTFKDAHAWLGHQGIAYHEITKFRPRVRKRRERRIERQMDLGLAYA